MFARFFIFRRFLVIAGLCVFSMGGVAAAAETSDNQLEIVFLALEDKVPSALSNLDPFIVNEGDTRSRAGNR